MEDIVLQKSREFHDEMIRESIERLVPAHIRSADGKAKWKLASKDRAAFRRKIVEEMAAEKERQKKERAKDRKKAMMTKGREEEGIVEMSEAETDSEREDESEGEDILVARGGSSELDNSESALPSVNPLRADEQAPAAAERPSDPVLLCDAGWHQRTQKRGHGESDGGKVIFLDA